MIKFGAVVRLTRPALRVFRAALLRARTDKREQECSTKALPHPVLQLCCKSTPQPLSKTGDASDDG